MTLHRGFDKPALCLVALLVTLIAMPFDASADEESDRIAAKEHYTKGKALYETGDFEAALKEFEASNAAMAHPVVMKSIAECKAGLGDLIGAVATLEEAREASPEEKKAAINERILELRGNIVALNITSEPEAEIFLNGMSTGQTTPAEFELNPGDYEVALTVDGYVPITKTVTLESGATTDVAVKFASEGVLIATPEPAPPEEESEPAAAVEEDNEKLPKGFWVCTVIAGLGVLSGTGFGVGALNAQKDFDDDPTQNKADIGKRKALISDVSFGVAAAAAVAGTIILVTNGKKESQGDASVAVVPAVGDKTFGVSAVIEF